MKYAEKVLKLVKKLEELAPDKWQEDTNSNPRARRICTVFNNKTVVISVTEYDYSMSDVDLIVAGDYVFEGKLTFFRRRSVAWRLFRIVHKFLNFEAERLAKKSREVAEQALDNILHL